MKMPTLVVSEWLPNGSRQLATAARQAGWDVLCLEGRKPPSALKVQDVVYYGGTDIADEVAQRLGLVLLEPPLDWLARLPRKYLHRQVRYATVAEARKLTTAAFVKPADATDKCFDAGVYLGGWAIPERRGFPEDTPVLIAEPITWEVEYRCFLLDGVVTTCAPYVRFGRWVRAGDYQWATPKPELEQVLAFCRSLAGDETVALPPAVTLDVGRIEGKGWAVVEANPVWSSGLYGCDPIHVLPVLRRASLRQQVLNDEDRRWSIRR
jgi:ATP-grasp domain, R2K clade family 2